LPDETDAKQILTASPAGNWTRPLGRPRIAPLKLRHYRAIQMCYYCYMDENHSAGSEIQWPQ